MLLQIALALSVSTPANLSECSASRLDAEPISLEAAFELVRTTRLSRGEFETTEAFASRLDAAEEAIPERLYIEIPLEFGRDVTYDADEEAFSIIPDIRNWGSPIRPADIRQHLEFNDGRFGIYRNSLDHLEISLLDEGHGPASALGLEHREISRQDRRGRAVRLGIFERFLERGLTVGESNLVEDIFTLGTYQTSVPIEHARRASQGFELVLEIHPRTPWLIGPVAFRPTQSAPSEHVNYYISADIRCIYVLMDGEITHRSPTR